MVQHTQTPPMGEGQAVSQNIDGVRQALRSRVPAIEPEVAPAVAKAPKGKTFESLKKFLKTKQKAEQKPKEKAKLRAQNKPVPPSLSQTVEGSKPAVSKTPSSPKSGQPKMDRRRTDRRRNNSRSTDRRKGRASEQALTKYIRMSYVSLFGLVFVFGGWTAFAKIQGAVIASGQVAVEGNPKILQHLEGGIISEIAVKNGDYVTQGQTVVKLDAIILEANLEAAETNYFENQALIDRLLSEQKGLTTLKWSRQMLNQRSNARVKLAMSGQEELFKARSRALSGQTDQLNQRLEQLSGEDTGLISEIDFTQSELNLVEQERVRMTDLLRQNLVSRNRVTQLELDATRLKNSISKLSSRRTALQSSIQEIQTEISQIGRLRSEEILTELRVAQTQANSFSEVLKTVSKKAKLVEIEAPVSGIVHELTASTVGGVIAPGQEIMQIIPKREALIIDAQVLPQDIDQITLGQETNVIFSALKQSAAPELSGVVSYISADNLIDPITGSAYFDVEISIADSQLPKLQGQTLIPGMPADVFVQTEERSVFDYLTAPLKDTFKKTMRDG